MRTIILSFTMIVLSIYQSAQAQQVDTLSIRQQRIVAIAATTARGDLENLKTSLDRGLDDGMTVNEIKEVLVHIRLLRISPQPACLTDFYGSLGRA